MAVEAKYQRYEADLTQAATGAVFDSTGESDAPPRPDWRRGFEGNR